MFRAARDRRLAASEAHLRRLESMLEQVEGQREALAESHEVPGGEDWAVTVVPAYAGRITPLPERRRRAFRDHLNRIVSEAAEARAVNAADELRLTVGPEDVTLVWGDDGWTLEGEEDESVAVSKASGTALPVLAGESVLRAACGMCRGECCTGGGVVAYLDRETIQHYMRANPQLRPREVLARYLDRVPRRTFGGSCVYHGEYGCTLPRDMRAGLCNTFYCRGLTPLKWRMENGAPPRSLVASVDLDAQTVRSTAFLRAPDPTRAAPALQVEAEVGSARSRASDPRPGYVPG